jgi:hypothetical protein
MTALETKEITDVIQRVQDWPAPMRIALARRILESLETRAETAATPTQLRGPSAAEVAAMFKTDKPAPSDEECQRILEEELSRKYGLETVRKGVRTLELQGS